MRNLLLVLGDQLNRNSAVFDGFDGSQDVVWMAEAAEELTHVWCHKLRIAFFLSAMRHFRDSLRAEGIQVHYHQLSARPEEDQGPDFRSILEASIRQLKPQRLILVEPGDHRVQKALENKASELHLALELRPDRHFLCSRTEFAEYASGGKNLVLENFYRHMRRKHNVLMDAKHEPVGGAWNFDKQNREPLKAQPAQPLTPKRFPPDASTREVLHLVAARFPDHPGSLEHFELPVTAQDASGMLQDFLQHRLGLFGSFQDAMWTGQNFLYHSRISALQNVKLIDPRDCISGAVEAYQNRRAPLNAVEGFVRQILGWREFVHGIYWLHMPGYLEKNFFKHTRPVPPFFWTGETDMHCVSDAMQNVLANGYAHHIQRLMVLGLFAQLYGVHPKLFHEWHMAMYLDAIDWVSLPNALGMSQYGDGGIIGTKPYCATGNYIHRMSNYCGGCRYDPRLAVGDNACPFTTLYYDFLDRHYDKLNHNPRLKFQLASLARKRKDKTSMVQIQQRAATLFETWEAPASAS